MKKKLLFIMMALFGNLGLIYAQNHYDFSSGTSSGHTLYYKYINDTNSNDTNSHLVKVTYPNSYITWENYVKPTGNLVIDFDVLHGYDIIAIDTGTFGACYDLTSVSIPNTVIDIYPWAFNLCTGLVSVNIPNYVTHIGANAFICCTNLTTVSMSNSVTRIDSCAFTDCHSLTTITLPQTLTYIGDKVILTCYQLRSINLPDSVTYIGNFAFAECYRLDSITFPNTIDIIRDGTFAFSGITYFNIPNSVTAICPAAFYDCERLKNITIPNSVSSIGHGAFAYCDSLTSITIPASVNYIGNEAFDHCIRLSSVTSLSPVPPVLDSDWFNPPVSDRNRVFYCVPSNITLYVPCGSETAYAASKWGYYFTNIQCINVDSTVNISVNVSNDTMGSVLGGGTYRIGDTITLTAIPHQNYAFIRWSNGIGDNPYSFIAVSDSNLTAIFSPMVSDTIILPPDTLFVHDTLYITLHDTTYLNNYIHDTTWITVPVHDTTIVNHYIHDTTHIILHDTTYINYYIHDTTIVNNYIHDTTYITLHDTVNTVIHDTITNTIHDTINNYLHDTTWLHDTTIITDTLWLTDTIFLYDTIIIHDTVYITGVENAEPLNAKIYARNGHIIVEGTQGNPVTLYDAVGRLLATKETLPTGDPCELPVTTTGVYLVKIGPYPARRIVIKR